MFRTAMSLEKGCKDKGKAVRNASDRQADRRMNRETNESAGRDPALEWSQAASLTHRVILLKPSPGGSLGGPPTPTTHQALYRPSSPHH